MLKSRTEGSRTRRMENNPDSPQAGDEVAPSVLTMLQAIKSILHWCVSETKDGKYAAWNYTCDGCGKK